MLNRGDQVIRYGIVGEPEDGHEGTRKEGKHEETDDEKCAQRRNGRVLLWHRIDIAESCGWARGVQVGWGVT